MVEPLKYENGKPLLSGCEAALPNILAPRMNLENVLNKNDTRLRIFSGTANPALSQVNFIILGSCSAFSHFNASNLFRQ